MLCSASSIIASLLIAASSSVAVAIGGAAPPEKVHQVSRSLQTSCRNHSDCYPYKCKGHRGADMKCREKKRDCKTEGHHNWDKGWGCSGGQECDAGDQEKWGHCTSAPTSPPTAVPSAAPTSPPTVAPSASPTASPTGAPTVAVVPGTCMAGASQCPGQCSGGRRRSWSGSADEFDCVLIVQEWEGWTVPVPAGTTTFAFDVKWGEWDHNTGGGGVANVQVPHCSIDATITRGAAAQSFSCDVSAIAGGTLAINKPTVTSCCEYVIIGNPKFG